jgi:hypothetical protein
MFAYKPLHYNHVVLKVTLGVLLLLVSGQAPAPASSSRDALVTSRSGAVSNPFLAMLLISSSPHMFCISSCCVKANHSSDATLSTAAWTLLLQQPARCTRKQGCQATVLLHSKHSLLQYNFGSYTTVTIQSVQ